MSDPLTSRLDVADLRILPATCEGAKIVVDGENCAQEPEPPGSAGLGADAVSKNDSG